MKTIEFKEGDRVIHENQGVGRIMKVNGPRTVDVSFKEGGLKRAISKSQLKLEKVAPKPPKKVKQATSEQVLAYTKKENNELRANLVKGEKKIIELNNTIHGLLEDSAKIEEISELIEERYEKRIEELEKGLEQAISAHKDSLRFIKSLLEATKL